MKQLKIKTMNKETKTIGQTELLEILMNVDKSTFVNIVSKTKVRMNKTNNPYYDKVFKVNKCNYLIGNEYETRVNTNDKKEGGEGNFVSEENKVGVHISKCVLFNEKHNSHYLQVERFDEIKPNVSYIFEGNEVEKTLFESYLVKVSESSRQPQERRVLVQSFKLSSIEEITLGGVHYIVER